MLDTQKQLADDIAKTFKCNFAAIQPEAKRIKDFSGIIFRQNSQGHLFFILVYPKNETRENSHCIRNFIALHRQLRALNFTQGDTIAIDNKSCNVRHFQVPIDKLSLLAEHVASKTAPVLIESYIGKHSEPIAEVSVSDKRSENNDDIERFLSDFVVISTSPR